MSENTSLVLREVLIEDLITRIRDGQKEVTKDGDVVEVSAPAAVLTAAIQYLKQYPPETAPLSGELSEALREYADKMPFSKKLMQKVGNA